jgi:response regulator RpfG family c-di-GMP phosphodiesterase
MVRPIVMMAEIEPPEGLSARKLVLETGKYNVITAYSLKEALETLATYPKVHAVVLHASLC